MMHPSGGDSMYLDMAMEKGDEEAISPTLACRENEKTGGFFRLFKKDSRTDDQTPPLDYGLSHPVEPTTIETDPPPDTSPAYIASTSLSSKRRGFRRSWIAPINRFNFTGFGVGGVAFTIQS
ncbi:uncharacterized protein EAE98_008853 [Botrytis deweyae]|uniref:Uncharacterized protein n=1 Tax=Botrytis deweyae TaxID=2478750 RepID=A0ABQ7ID96_9HELO|nr:uncharacterized protein EAE98_008853 [Botrytis deweyae]KAF7920824.1 hypothetical protein EAE98_008853 [Botrytis deweyae]